MSVKYCSLTDEQIDRIKNIKGVEIEKHGDHYDIDMSNVCITLTKIGSIYNIASYNYDSCTLDLWSFDNMFDVISEIKYLKGGE